MRDIDCTLRAINRIDAKQMARGKQIQALTNILLGYFLFSFRGK
jgi:hypothetical protein